jgi:hypothetical protein
MIWPGAMAVGRKLAALTIIGEPPTVSVADPLIDPEVAVMVVVPRLTLMARPEALIVATSGLEELQDTLPISACVLPSMYVPVAANCTASPTGIEKVVGLTAINMGVAGDTVNTVEALIEPELTVIVALPNPVLVTRPLAPGELPIVATEGTDELQVTEAVTN